MRILAIVSAAIAIAGCDPTVDSVHVDNIVVAPTNNITIVVANAQPRFLCVGMEQSARFGSCPGCELDAQRMFNILNGKLGYQGDMLISTAATKSAVVFKLKAGIEATPPDGLFIFSYSGHGGQEYLGGKEPDGSDSPDEYLCLYDSHMLDDEIWEIVSKCRGRVFLYFDACHSATMYRGVAAELSVKPGEAKALAADMVKSKGFKFDTEKFLVARALSDNGLGAVRILCWSGCKEAEYSYGSSRGGELTNALVKHWKKGITYKTLWPLMVSTVQKSEPSQHPVETGIGGGFDGVEAFR